MKTGKREGSNRGVAAVEFALILPIFLLLLMGIVEFGRYFFVQHTLQFATREGVRLALVGKTLDDPLGNPMSRVDSIVAMIQNYASIALNPANLSISIFPVQPNYSDPTGWKGTLNAGNSGDYMRVRTQYTFAFITPLIGNFFSGGTVALQAEATYRNEVFD